MFVGHQPAEVSPPLLADEQNVSAVGGKQSELGGAEEVDAEADRLA